jgi:glutathione-regulated potassium-efflux system ancillary protein KefG
MKNILLILAHPDLRKSRVNSALVNGIRDKANLIISDLYKKYADFKINVMEEQSLLLSADIIILQYPFYWYSSPSLLKEWIDKVFLYGFAYGKTGDKLSSKSLLTAISADGTFEGYQRNGYNGYTIKELLRPVELTARFCKMNYLDPFVIYDTDNITDSDIKKMVIKYSLTIDSTRVETTPQ